MADTPSSSPSSSTTPGSTPAPSPAPTKLAAPPLAAWEPSPGEMPVYVAAAWEGHPDGCGAAAITAAPVDWTLKQPHPSKHRCRLHDVHAFMSDPRWNGTSSATVELVDPSLAESLAAAVRSVSNQHLRISVDVQREGQSLLLHDISADATQPADATQLGAVLEATPSVMWIQPNKMQVEAVRLPSLSPQSFWCVADLSPPLLEAFALLHDCSPVLLSPSPLPLSGEAGLRSAAAGHARPRHYRCRPAARVAPRRR